MIKRTLYFGNPAYLNLSESQMLVRFPEVLTDETILDSLRKEIAASIPIEDIGIVVLDNPRITITHGLLDALMNNNTAVLTCDSKHHPSGLLLPLSGNTIQSERFKYQIEASEPLKKQLWAQTISQKIRNQAAHFEHRKLSNLFFVSLYRSIKSGDSKNCEATAAAYYWQHIFKDELIFKRHRDGFPPNNFFNYAYAILRATVARSIVGAGLIPTLGIFHRNRYNAFCLADDLMEPYRPIVDKLVCDCIDKFGLVDDLSKEIKAELLKIPVLDVMMEEGKSPLMVATQRTAVSLVKCFKGEARKLNYPEFV
jgi:CRISPR-associated protein Cas1